MKKLIDYITESYITEMAYTRRNFEDKITGVIPQIVQNWCLVRWAEMYPEHHLSVNRNHWATELKGHINSICVDKVKSGRKDKVIRNIMIDTLELNYDTAVAQKIRKKFNDEGLSKYINIMAHEFTKNVTEVCNIMSSDNEEEVDNYVNEPIG